LKHAKALWNCRAVGSDSFEQQIVIDAEAGSAPNVAVFPQPGLAADMAARGFLTPLADGMGRLGSRKLRRRPVLGRSRHLRRRGRRRPVLRLLLQGEREVAGLVRAGELRGCRLRDPETMEELKALTEQIVADGETPWCIGLGSGAATGWPATDWVEDMMLRTQPPEVYDGGCPTRSRSPIRRSSARSRNSAGSPATTTCAGGAGAVATTDFRDSPKGLFSSPPQCYMHRQASFIPAFFPEGTEVGEDATSSTSRPMRKRISATRFSARGTLMGDHQRQPRRAWPDRVPADADRA
jgi:alpha-glucoside transport system substrate-binding protein